MPQPYALLFNPLYQLSAGFGRQNESDILLQLAPKRPLSTAERVSSAGSGLMAREHQVG
jgi:hypothetical protein